MNFIKHKFPELNTERLLLREILPSDIAQVFKGLSDPKVIQYYGVSYNSIEATQIQMKWYDDLYFNQTGVFWALCLKDEPDLLIGTCGLYQFSFQHKKAEIGFWLVSQAQKRGLMSEAIKQVLRYGFEILKLNRIEAFVEPQNQDSKNLLAKHNFSMEGTMKQCEIKNKAFIDLQIYALLAKEYALKWENS